MRAWIKYDYYMHTNRGWKYSWYAVYKLTSREHRTYSTGDSNNNIMAYYGLRSPCEAVRQRTLVGTRKLKERKKKISNPFTAIICSLSYQLYRVSNLVSILREFWSFCGQELLLMSLINLALNLQWFCNILFECKVWKSHDRVVDEYAEKKF